MDDVAEAQAELDRAEGEVEVAIQEVARLGGNTELVWLALGRLQMAEFLVCDARQALAEAKRDAMEVEA